MNIQKIENTVNKAEYFSGVIQILEKEKTILKIAKGYSKYEDELLNNTETAFGIASGTKGFTALGILRLIDKCKLSLNDQVFEILPYDFPNMNNKVTVKQLLTHTSGIYDYFDEDVIDNFRQLFEKVPVHRILGPKDMLPFLIEGKSYFEPGEKFKYCNSGFVILGMLIEEISKTNYSNFINNEVCKPLGLTRTGCYKTNQLPKNCAYGYLKDKNNEWYSNIFEIPMICTADGGIYTTANDIAKMWKNLFTENFLSKDLLKETFTSQVNVWNDIYYGLGFWIEKDNDGNTSNYYLTGGDPGVCFHSKYYLNEERILTILGNTSDGADILLDEITHFI